MNEQQKWLKDLQDGNKGEVVVANHITDKKGLPRVTEFNDDYKWDFIIDNLKFEIKTDCYEHYKNITTNNLFIEVECNGKPSGITKTLADWFIYYLPYHEKAYIIKVSNLKVLVNSGDYRKVEQAGDGGRVKGYLINRITNREHFKVIKIKRDTSIWE